MADGRIVNRITLCPMQLDDLPGVLGLQVAEAQLGYVAPIADILEQFPASAHRHLVKRDNRVIGFFMIDMEYSRVHPFAPRDDLGFRMFMIDQSVQGQGCGSAAMRLLPAYLLSCYPDRKQVWLTVNCRNLAAYQCYLRNGFQDTGAQYLDGGFGPQHIMVMPFTSGGIDVR
ncbi:MAG: GNAT family N-acetyltransferase [Nitrincola lacisaponensis]|uniref:GNAT family N-acetyltransferase n=1 Tax=Nitrincola lacisaponensis TaxID=267850 RepID=UPI003918E947